MNNDQRYQLAIKIRDDIERLLNEAEFDESAESTLQDTLTEMFDLSGHVCRIYRREKRRAELRAGDMWTWNVGIEPS